MDVHTNAGLSPGTSAKKHGLQLDKETKRKKDQQSSVQFKRRCLLLKEQRKANECALQTREGDTYSSNIGQKKKIPDITQIPEPTESMKLALFLM